MALSDLKVYSETAYSAATEVLQQQVELFNAATEGAIQLSHAAHVGDFNEVAFFQKIAGGTVRRRNPYGSGAVASKSLKHIADVMVKIASGTPPIEIDPSQFRWIQQNPAIAGAAFGQQLAKDILADMLNTGLGAAYAAVKTQGRMVFDATASADEKTMSFRNMNRAARKFGDQSSRIRVWTMHSAPMHDLYDNALSNQERLFVYGTVNVNRDPFGRLMVMTDSPSLVTDAATDVYHSLGLTGGAIVVQQNDDFDANEETRNGQENIQRTYQAEWSHQLGLAGYAWDKANGGKAPTDAALLTGTNWDQYVTDDKETLGVALETN